MRPTDDRSVAGLGRRAQRLTLFWTGCALTLLGLGALVSPALTYLTVGAVAGWLLWLAGALMFGASLLMTGEESFLNGLAAGLMSVAAGAFLLFNPAAGALAVTLLTTAFLMIDGAYQLALALKLRPLKVWRWILSSAIASVVAALLIAVGVPARFPPSFGVIVGLAVASSGIALILLSRGGADGQSAPLTAARWPT